MKKLSLLFLLLLSLANLVQGQTLTGSFTTTPCNNDGVYAVTTTGLTLPITYTYYLDNAIFVHSNVNSATDQLTNIPMGQYGYIYVQAQGSNGTAGYQDSYTPAFSFSFNATDPWCPATLGTITATQNSGTSGPFDFVWTNIQSGNTYTGNNVSAPEGQYTVDITDLTTGCLLHIQDSAVSIQQLSTIVGTTNTTAANCTNGTATVVASGGTAPYTYLWSNGSTNATISNLTMGYYEVVISDAQGCHSTPVYAYINQGTNINVNTTVTNATCLQTNGSAFAFGSGGQPPYSYSWSNGQLTQNATNLSGSNGYTVFVTDANGCIGQGYAYIGASTPITAGYTSTPSLCTAPTGSATVTANGGTAPYTYQWGAVASVNSPTISNLAPGNYSFLITDANGCVRSGAVTIPPISTISATMSASTVICPNTTGNVSVSASSTSMPLTYLWNTGATTSSLTAVPLGAYSCVITDANGCSVTKYNSLTTHSPMNVNMATTPATCQYANDGGATAYVFGGTAPYSYSYSNGGGTAMTASNLPVGYNYVTVQDANGCSAGQHFYISNSNSNPNCYCTITGTVYYDANGNCTQDAGENGIQNIMIHCSGFGYTFTDANGQYSFQVPTGTYTINEQVNQYYPLAACQSNGISVNVVAASGCNTVVNFANSMANIHDLKIVTMNATTPPIPGMAYNQLVYVKNEGTNTESGIQLGYTHDGQLTYNFASGTSFVQLNPSTSPYAYSVQTGFPSLTPNTSHTTTVNYSTPTNIPLNTNVILFDTVTDMAPISTNWLLDYSPWNNVNSFGTTVIGAYDPNYKEVSPRGTGSQGEVPLSTKEFDYTIHFQNEGTYFAQNIVVTDQLDSDLDWTTFKPGYSEYPYTTTISETGLVTFTFPNINLPWKETYGDELSSSLVNYSIQRKATATVGTVFTNTANIYFDFNEAIVTNTTVNTLVADVVGIEENGANMQDGTSIELFPVPVSENLTIRINNNTGENQATIYVIDLMGHVLKEKTVSLESGSTAFEANVAELTSGTYLTRVQFASGKVITKKIVVVTK